MEPAREEESTELREESVLMVERTDSLWQVMSQALDSTRAVSEEDSLAAREAGPPPSRRSSDRTSTSPR